MAALPESQGLEEIYGLNKGPHQCRDPGFGAGAGGLCSPSCCRVEIDANDVILIGQQWIIFQTVAVTVKRMRSAKIS